MPEESSFIEIETNSLSPSSDIALSQDVLTQALSFKGASADLFNRAVEEVELLVKNGDSIYPPRDYPSWREPTRGSTVGTTLKSDSYGRLAPAEAVAVLVLQEESLALLQFFAEDFETTRKINDVLGTGPDVWQSDVIAGIVDFNQMLGLAAGVRERIISGQGKPQGKTIGDKAKLHWYELFEQALEQDDLKIRANTAAKAVEEITRQAREEIPRNPEGARNQKEIDARIAGKIKGAELAEVLYLETVALAGERVSDNIEPAAKVTIVESPKSS